MQDDRDNIIDKIQALLAKTPARGASEAEATEALKMAQRLLTKHNLTMAEVEAQGGKGGSPVTGGALKTTTEWQMFLAGAIAKHMFVSVVRSWGMYNTRGGVEHGPILCFIGRLDNVRVVAELYRWVEPQFVRIPREAALAEGRELKRSVKWIRSFRMGMMVRVNDRLREAAAEDAAQDVRVTALVVRHDDENLAYQKERFGYLEDAEVKEIDHRAYGKGARAGEEVSLTPSSRQVEGE